MFTCTNTSDQHIKMKKSIGSSMKFWAILISAQTPSKWKKMLSGVWPHSTPVTKANHPKIDLVTELCFPADITLRLETKNNHLWKTKWLEGKKSNIHISLKGQAYSRLFFLHVSGLFRAISFLRFYQNTFICNFDHLRAGKNNSHENLSSINNTAAWSKWQLLRFEEGADPGNTNNSSNLP